MKEDRTAEDLLFQVLVDWGVDLTLPIRRENVLGKTVFFVDDNALVACFDMAVTEALVKELAGHEPLRAVFRDNGFVFGCGKGQRRTDLPPSSHPPPKSSRSEKAGMKFKFKVQSYQTNAVESVVDCFAGQPMISGVTYRITPGREVQTGAFEEGFKKRKNPTDRGTGAGKCQRRPTAAKPAYI